MGTYHSTMAYYLIRKVSKFMATISLQYSIQSEKLDRMLETSDIINLYNWLVYILHLVSWIFQGYFSIYINTHVGMPNAFRTVCMDFWRVKEIFKYNGIKKKHYDVWNTQFHGPNLTELAHWITYKACPNM